MVNKDGTPPNKGTKSPSKLLSLKYQYQSSSGEQNKNLSSPKRVHFINIITLSSKDDKPRETRIVEPNTKGDDHDTTVKVKEEFPPSSDTEFVCTKENDGDIMFIEIIKKYDDSCEEEIREDESAVTGELEDISSIIDPRLLQVVLGKPFVRISNMTHDLSLGVVKFTDETNEIAYKMPYKIEQYNSLSDLEIEHTKLVYLKNEEDKRKGVEYVMNKILRFYKECLELGPEYLTRLENEGGVT
ncbi:hypothetical protein Tco_0734593 [Tanacetum coccineum]